MIENDLLFVPLSVPLADLVDGTAHVVIKSIASKLVSNQELGELNRLIQTYT